MNWPSSVELREGLCRTQTSERPDMNSTSAAARPSGRYARGDWGSSGRRAPKRAHVPPARRAEDLMSAMGRKRTSRSRRL